MIKFVNGQNLTMGHPLFIVNASDFPFMLQYMRATLRVCRERCLDIRRYRGHRSRYSRVQNSDSTVQSCLDSSL